MIIRILSDLLDTKLVSPLRGEARKTSRAFDKIVGYDGIKRTFLRSVNSEEPVHILLVGPPGQAKTLFLKCMLEALGEKEAFFTVGGNASKSGIIYLEISYSISIISFIIKRCGSSIVFFSLKMKPW